MSSWYEKYRPDTLDDYVWTDENAKRLLEKWIANPLEFPHLLLPGSTGTGKTTLAKIIRRTLEDSGRARALYIPANINGSVETIRSDIMNFCEIGGFDELKVVIMDEADKLSAGAEDTLRNVLDMFEADVRFIFTCNYLEKISKPVQGRFLIVPINTLDMDQFTDRLVDIAVSENVNMDSDAALERLQEIVDGNYPNMRKAITTLQASTHEGELYDSVEAEPEWAKALLGVLQNFSTTAVRELVARIPADSYEHAYRVLYQNSEIFGDHEQEAIIVIADHLYRHSHAGLPDITLCSCLIELAKQL